MTSKFWLGIFSLGLFQNLAFGQVFLGPSKPAAIEVDKRLAQVVLLPDACFSSARQISLELFHYEVAARERNRHTPNDEAGAKHAYDKIKAILKKTEDSAPECFKPLAMFYALHSHAETIQENALIPTLYRTGHLQPISLNERKRQGGAWMTKLSRGPLHQILGAYDCGSSVIHFDPYAAPFDVLSILEHEADHLLRDKFMAPDSLELSLREFVLIDELLSSMRAGHAQMIDRTVLPTKFDLTLYDYYGNLAGIWMELGEGSRYLYEDWGLFSGYLEKGALNPKARDRMIELMKLVDRAYFTRSAIQFDKTLAKLQKAQIQNLLPGVMRERSEVDDLAGALGPQELSRLKLALQSPSPLCRQFQVSVRSGQMNDYLGAHIQAPNSGGGIKPGSEGVKPGSEGVKPGSEGVKPGNRGIRPCLHPTPGF